MMFFLLSTNGLLAQVEAIPLSNTRDIDSIRKEIASYIWGDEKTPEILEDASPEPYSVYAEAGLPNSVTSSPYLNDMETFRVLLKHGFVSKVYIFHPAISNGLNIPVIFHSGHGPGVFLEDTWVHNNGSPYSVSVVDFFLSRGFDVIGIDMPLYGANTYPLVVKEDGKEFNIAYHDDLFLLKNPLYYFIAPIKTVLDYFQIHKNYDRYMMFGYSGGGWTTVMYSAVDTRIQQSFHIASSMPVPLRTNWSDHGDAEQNFPGFYEKFNYSTLYFLGAEGKDRLQYQVANKNDNCCFTTDATNTWAKDVQLKLKDMAAQGEFHFFYDTFSTWHRISSVAVDSMYFNMIHGFLNKKLKEDNRVVQTFSNVLCGNDKLFAGISNNANNSVQWYRNGGPVINDTTGRILIDEEGLYYAKLINYSGATAFTDTINIKHQPTVQIPVIVQQEDMLYSSFNEGNQWFFNGEPIEGGIHSAIHPVRPGKYSVMATSQWCSGPMSLPYDYGLVIFPNPAKNEIHLRTQANMEIIYYTIRRIDGVVVMTGQLNNQSTIYFANKLVAGMYTIELRNLHDFRAVEKLLVR